MATERGGRFLALVWRKAGSWYHLPWPEKGWLLVAYPLLGLARLVLLGIAFRYVAPRLGQRLEHGAITPLATPRQITQAWHIGRAIRIAACYTPWESKCLAQAMVARVLLGLRRVPYALYLGVRKDDGAGMAAHAWVCTGATAVTGGRGFGQFTVVGAFVSKGIVPEQ